MASRDHQLAGTSGRTGTSTDSLGFWTATAITVIGTVYAVAIAILTVTGQFGMPPSEPVQLFGGIVTILMAPTIVVLMACLHISAAEERKAYSLSAFGFAILFAAMISINRYVQLTVIRQGVLHGATEELQLFMPYGSNSIMLSLEFLGWGLFFGLAAFCSAAVFTGKGIERWLRGLFIAYGVLGLTSAVGMTLASPISAVGFVAWGPILDVIAVLLAVWFRRRMRMQSQSNAQCCGS